MSPPLTSLSVSPLTLCFSSFFSSSLPLSPLSFFPLSTLSLFPLSLFLSLSSSSSSSSPPPLPFLRFSHASPFFSLFFHVSFFQICFSFVSLFSPFFFSFFFLPFFSFSIFSIFFFSLFSSSVFSETFCARCIDSALRPSGHGANCMMTGKKLRAGDHLAGIKEGQLEVVSEDDVSIWRLLWMGSPSKVYPSFVRVGSSKI